MRSLGALIFLPLAACTSNPPSAPPTSNQRAAAAPSAADPCLPATLDRYNGELANSDLGARMLAVTHKRALRWVSPGMMVTMDFREDRLTVYLDAANRVERASCS